MKDKKYKHKALVSVVMSVFNGEAYLAQAIRSVLKQSYSNFEFIIINDCSTDRTAEILRSFHDRRIHIIENKENLRLAASLNKGISLAKGKYVLRMDADDICMPDRFERQVAFMEDHPEISLAFGRTLKFSGSSLCPEFDTNDYTPEAIRSVLLFYNVIPHPCVILRRELFDTFSYRPEYTVTEDLNLWLELCRQHKFARIPQLMLLYRIHPGQITARHNGLQRLQEMRLKRPALEALTGPLSRRELLFHSLVCAKRESTAPKELLKWLHFLKRCNRKKRIYDIPAFERTLIRMFFTVGLYNRYSAKAMCIGLISFGLLPVFSFFCRLAFYRADSLFHYFIIKRRAQRLLDTYENKKQAD